jgi:hypothetical protein
MSKPCCGVSCYRNGHGTWDMKLEEAVVAVQRLYRGHLGRREAARVQLFFERDRLRSKTNRQQLTKSQVIPVSNEQRQLPVKSGTSNSPNNALKREILINMNDVDSVTTDLGVEHRNTIPTERMEKSLTDFLMRSLKQNESKLLSKISLTDQEDSKSSQLAVNDGNVPDHIELKVNVLETIPSTNSTNSVETLQSTVERNQHIQEKLGQILNDIDRAYVDRETKPIVTVPSRYASKMKKDDLANQNGQNHHETFDLTPKYIFSASPSPMPTPVSSSSAPILSSSSSSNQSSSFIRDNNQTPSKARILNGQVNEPTMMRRSDSGIVRRISSHSKRPGSDEVEYRYSSKLNGAQSVITSKRQQLIARYNLYEER